MQTCRFPAVGRWMKIGNPYYKYPSQSASAVPGSSLVTGRNCFKTSHAHAWSKMNSFDMIQEGLRTHSFFLRIHLKPSEWDKKRWQIHPSPAHFAITYFLIARRHPFWASACTQPNISNGFRCQQAWYRILSSVGKDVRNNPASTTPVNILIDRGSSAITNLNHWWSSLAPTGSLLRLAHPRPRFCSPHHSTLFHVVGWDGWTNTVHFHVHWELTLLVQLARTCKQQTSTKSKTGARLTRTIQTYKNTPQSQISYLARDGGSHHTNDAGTDNPDFASTDDDCFYSKSINTRI